MNRARGLVERVSGLEQTRRLAVDRKFVRALDHVSKCVMAGVAVRGAGEPRRAVDEAHADFSSRKIGERLRGDLLNAMGRGLRGMGPHQPGTFPLDHLRYPA